MKQDYPALGVQVLCRLFGKTRHAYYDNQWRQQENVFKDEVILQIVHKIRKSLPRLGTRKLQEMLTAELQEHRIEVGRIDQLTSGRARSLNRSRHATGVRRS